MADVHLDFIRAEIQTGFTMLKLAATERNMWDRNGVDQAMANARKALESAKRFLPSLRNAPEATLAELSSQIIELDAAIRQFDGRP